MTDKMAGKFNFPTLESFELRRFSLYTQEPNVNIDFNAGVFCLAGANGLGKSTFLSALNFALTGIVPDPDRTFKSVPEFHKHNKKFSKEYFSGRINEEDRDISEVAVSFFLNNRRYRIVRGFFEPDELREFSIEGNDSKDPVIDNITPGQKNDYYEKSMCKDIGLKDFEQFVFVQHYILTFDENRHLLFWNDKTLETALSILFGYDPSNAALADLLRRDVEKADSNARNEQWQATQLRNKIRDLIDATQCTITVDSDLRAEHEVLNIAHDEIIKNAEKIEDQLQDENLRLANLTAKEISLRAEYADLFKVHLRSTGTPFQHPIITESIATNSCSLCGASDVAGKIQEKIALCLCPLCETKSEKITSKPNSINSIETLKKKDLEIVLNRRESERVRSCIDRLEHEMEQTKLKTEVTVSKLREFENANRNVLHQLNSSLKSDAAIGVIIEGYRKQMQEHLDTKKEQRRIRDQKKRDLMRLYTELERNYLAVENDFVPVFNNLAHAFIGLDIDIRLTKGTSGVTLVLDVEGKSRRQHFQLSESQRFFLDIALRMAFAQHTADEESSPTLIIDTPEGSLDIAYESRAGELFAKFVENGNHIVMTANINASNLLIRLAQRTKKNEMTLCRMTEWTDLSEVQVSEEKLFEQAFCRIEAEIDQQEG